MSTLSSSNTAFTAPPQEGAVTAAKRRPGLQCIWSFSDASVFPHPASRTDRAARIDGANQFTIFWRIALPLAKPALASLAIITFTNTWNSYFLPLVFLNSWEKMTLPLGMFALSNVYGSGNVSVIMAAVGVAVCPGPHFVPGCSAPDRLRDGRQRGERVMTSHENLNKKI